MWLLVHRLLLTYLFLVNAITFFLYGIDKSRARRNGGGGRRTRIAEAKLHKLSLVGGSIGALLGQKLFRHKVRKMKFQIIYWSTVVLQIGLILWLFVVP